MGLSNVGILFTWAREKPHAKIQVGGGITVEYVQLERIYKLPRRRACSDLENVM